jgi:tungstate transport system ATP-binding protein
MPERPPQSHPIYRLHDLTKSYDDRLVLDLHTLEIYQGEILAIVGPSGAGKSTLLRLLNFIEPPTTGQIVFKDVIFQAGREMPLSLRRKVTTVFQRPMLLERSVRDNVAYGLRLRGKRDAGGKIDATLSQVGLDRLARQRARTLSGGEAQRVALSRALANGPEILLADEPTGNLDSSTSDEIVSLLRELNRERGLTVVMVTHEEPISRSVSHRILRLLDGTLVDEERVEVPHVIR